MLVVWLRSMAALAKKGWLLYLLTPGLGSMAEHELSAQALGGSRRSGGFGSQLPPINQQAKLESDSPIIELLQRAIELNGNVAEYHFRLAYVYWNMGGTFRSDRKHTYDHFFLSAKLDPTFAAPFSYLGMQHASCIADCFVSGFFSQDIENNVPRAKKCYQKAVSLDAEEAEAGKRLRDIYLNDGEELKAIELHESVTSQTMRVKWAWMAKAVHQQKLFHLDDAVKAYHTTLRCDVNDFIAWGAL